ncbi:hypothetical protein MTO96_048257 [Rhipicephalus appendiculatus]
MAGGLFAICRRYLWKLGVYDVGLNVRGGEQYELYFKIWQCGGTMMDAPCSRVGHIYRKFALFPNPGLGDFVGRNYHRVAEMHHVVLFGVVCGKFQRIVTGRKIHYKKYKYNDL